MSQKRTKKLRQMMRKEYAKDIRDIAEINGRFLKTKPRWVPMWLWMKGLKIFVKIS